MVKRTSVVVYYNYESSLQMLKKDINVYHVSTRGKYAVLYFDKEKEDEIMKFLENNKGFSKIVKSDVAYEKYDF